MDHQKYHQKYHIIAGVSGTFSILAFSNLVLNAHLTKETEHLTFTWIFLVLLAQILMFIYWLLNNIYAIYIPAACLTLGALYILYIKINYDNGKKIEESLKAKNILSN